MSNHLTIEEKACRIKHLMVDNDLTVKQLADKIGVQQSALSRCLNTKKTDQHLSQALETLVPNSSEELTNEL